VCAAALSFAIVGLFGGLAGTFLAGPLHRPSSALAGLTIFVVFGAGATFQSSTTTWPVHRLLAVGMITATVGLIGLVVAVWLSPPSLVLFLISGLVVGTGNGGIFRAGFLIVVATAGADDLAGVLATFFGAGYVGLSVPVVGVGVALQALSPKVTMLVFAVAVVGGLIAAAPLLLGRGQLVSALEHSG
jgi:hypothetical protein